MWLNIYYKWGNTRLKRSILFVTEHYNPSIINYIKTLGLEFNIEFTVLNTLEEINKSDIKYVISRVFPKILYVVWKTNCGIMI